jgi:transposase InsO family protein
MPGKEYRLYTDASTIALAGALQQVQPIKIVDLKGTKLYNRLKRAYDAGESPPLLISKLSSSDPEAPDRPSWMDEFDQSTVFVERVIAYWSRTCKDAETRYSATEREALAAKESLVKFQPFIEGEKILLITDHAALQWAKTYENANQRLSAWGAVFAAYPGMEIVHRPGRVHSNVDPISRLVRAPPQVSPSDEALPALDVGGAEKELVAAWKEFTYQSARGKAAFAVTRSQDSARMQTGTHGSSPQELAGTSGRGQLAQEPASTDEQDQHVRESQHRDKRGRYVRKPVRVGEQLQDVRDVRDDLHESSNEQNPYAHEFAPADEQDQYAREHARLDEQEQPVRRPIHAGDQDSRVQIVPREGPKAMVHVEREVAKEFEAGYKEDREFRNLWTAPPDKSDDNSQTRYSRFVKGENGLLYFKDADWPASQVRLCVPSSQTHWIIREAHDSAHEAAHGGHEKTLSRLRENFYWSSMRKDVLAYCETCDVCQKTKHNRTKPQGFLTPLRIPQQPYETITMDFITGLPESHGKTAILVVVDKLTKFATFIPTTSDVTAETTARLLFQRVFKSFGLPLEIVSDRDPRFTSNFWKALAKYYKTRLAMSTARHPQTDGQTEILNQTLETMLRAYVANDRESWVLWLDVLELSYNSAKHKSTGTSPARALMGFTPKTPLGVYARSGIPLPQTVSQRADERITELESHRLAARDAITRASDRQAFYYDKNRKAVLFKEGDEVLINPHALELVDVAGAGRKLMHRRIGPFTISQVISPTAYRLNLPDTLPMHNVVNIQHLTKYRRALEEDRPKLANPRDALIASEEYEVKDILDSRFNKRKHRKEYLVRWVGYGPEHDSWQTATDLRNAPEIMERYKRL